MPDYLALRYGFPGVVVASADATEFERKTADYVCDGTADQVQINLAVIDAAVLQARGGPVGGKQRGMVALTGGRFNLSAPIVMYSGVTLAGTSRLSELRSVGMSGSGMVTLANTSQHLTAIRDIYFDGNASAGGTSKGIYYNAATASHTAYPPTNPDAYHLITGNYFYNFGWSSSGTFNGRTMVHLSDTGVRGCIVTENVLRQGGGHGLWYDGASDVHSSDNVIGTFNGTGLLLATGNGKSVNDNAFYCDQWGLDVSSSRCRVIGFSSQDNHNGIRWSGDYGALIAPLVDTCRDEGILVNSASYVIVSDYQILWRASARYPSMANGLRLTGNPTNSRLPNGVIANSGITTRFSGTPGSGTGGNYTGNNSNTTFGS